MYSVKRFIRTALRPTNNLITNKSLNNIASTHTHNEISRNSSTKSKFSSYKNISSSSDLIFDDTHFINAFERLCNSIKYNYENPSTNNNTVRNTINRLKYNLGVELDKSVNVNIQNSRNANRPQVSEVGLYGTTNVLPNINITTYNTSKLLNNIGNPTERTYINRANIYLETLILHNLYKYSDSKHRKAIPKPYYLTHLVYLIENNHGTINYKLSKDQALRILKYSDPKYRLYKRKMSAKPFRTYIDTHKDDSNFVTNFFTILKKICELLNYFQVKFGLVHNNFTLENILIDDSLNPYFINFGVAAAELKINNERKYICIEPNNILYLKINSNKPDNIARSTDLFTLLMQIMDLMNEEQTLNNNCKIIYNTLYKIYDYNYIYNNIERSIYIILNESKFKNDKKEKIKEAILSLINSKKNNIYDIIKSHNKKKNNIINIKKWSRNIYLLDNYIRNRYSVSYFSEIDLPSEYKKYFEQITYSNVLRRNLFNIVTPSLNNIKTFYNNFIPSNMIRSLSSIR